VFKLLKEILFPNDVKCIICDNEITEKYSICNECLNKLKLINGQRCPICLDKVKTDGYCADCLKKKPFYTKLFCVYVYDSPIKELILKFKSGKNQFLREYFARIAVDTVPKEIFEKCTLITFVPCSDEKIAIRGYDQAEAIAKAVSEKTGIPYKKTIVRLNGNKTAKLNKSKRLESVKDRYIFCENVFGETVLIIDDVCTTSATLRYCSEQLQIAGAKEVFCFTVARTDKH